MCCIESVTVRKLQEAGHAPFARSVKPTSLSRSDVEDPAGERYGHLYEPTLPQVLETVKMWMEHSYQAVKAMIVRGHETVLESDLARISSSLKKDRARQSKLLAVARSYVIASSRQEE